MSQLLFSGKFTPLRRETQRRHCAGFDDRRDAHHVSAAPNLLCGWLGGGDISMLSDTGVNSFITNLAKNILYFPALFAALVLLIVFLFFEKLTEPLKHWLVPSLIAYALATSLVGYVQLILYARIFEQEKMKSPEQRHAAILSLRQLYSIFFIHTFLLVTFIFYNVFRGSM
jgi:hypothetical protein